MLDMSTGALYKLGDGECHLSSCFPVRAFSHPREDGAGHWLVAHRETMEQRHRDIRRTKSNRTDHPTGSDWGTPATGNTLDGSLLIRLHCVENPSDLCSIDISEQRLTLVKNEDFKEFDNIVYINASDNSLSIESFRSFSLLRELDLSLNGCCDMRFNPEDFPHLEVLDLSYNNLSEADIVYIGRLAGLKVLCLTGNKLHRLPANMAGSKHHPTLPTPTDKQKAQFGALEMLTLDDNRLTSDVFRSLANLTRLRHLNLQGNNISEIPFMPPNGDAAQTGSNQGHFLGVSQPSVGETEFSLPLPQLRFLSLAHNKIAEEEALLATALFPSLAELVIHNNPLTTRRTGDPPRLTYLLSVRRGVKVTRADRPEVRRPSVMPPGGLKHKVRNNGKALKGPTLTRRPRGSLRERESQAESGNPGSSQVQQKEMMNGPRDAVTDANQQAQSVFVTQPEDLREEEFERHVTEGGENTGNKGNSVAVSEKFNDYDILMAVNGGTADVVAEATGIQTAVRMLERALKSVHACRDVRAKTTDPPSATNTRPQGKGVSDDQEVNKQVYREAVSLLKEACRNYKTVHAKMAEATTRIEQE